MAATTMKVRALTQIQTHPNIDPLPKGRILTEEDLPKRELQRLVNIGAAELVKKSEESGS